MKGAKKLKKFIDDEIIPTHMQRTPKIFFVILIKENPTLPHNVQIPVGDSLELMARRVGELYV